MFFPAGQTSIILHNAPSNHATYRLLPQTLKFEAPGLDASFPSFSVVGYSRRVWVNPLALPPQFLNGLTDFFAYFLVGLISRLLTFNLLPAYLILGLSGAKQISGQFQAAHMVEDLLIWFELFEPVNIPGRLPVVQPTVALILKDGKVEAGDNSGILSCIG